MTNEDTARELEKLRADVAALSDARREAAANPPDKSAESVASANLQSSEPAVSEAHRSQLEELGELLQAEIRDLPTITCLAVFSLGILMGRLMR